MSFICISAGLSANSSLKFVHITVHCKPDFILHINQNEYLASIAIAANVIHFDLKGGFLLFMMIDIYQLQSGLLPALWLMRSVPL